MAKRTTSARDWLRAAQMALKSASCDSGMSIKVRMILSID
jgi:hypothetical protein